MLWSVTTDASCINRTCALQLSIIKRTLCPAIRASNPFNHSSKMTCVIQAFELLRYLHPKLFRLTFLKQQRVFVFANEKKWKLVRAISIAAHSQRETLLVLFASFKLLCGQGIVRLLRCHVLVKVSRWFGSGHTISCYTYLHSVKQSSFIHVVDVMSLILIQSQTNLRQALFNHSHVG